MLFPFAQCRKREVYKYRSSNHSFKVSFQAMVLGWPVPITFSESLTVSDINCNAFLLWFCSFNVCDRLNMLISVEGCSSTSALLLVFMTCAFSSSASVHRPWFRYVDARFDVTVSVSRCSSSSTLWLVFMTCTFSSSASVHRPWYVYVDARVARLASVEGCSSPHNSVVMFKALWLLASAITYLPWAQAYKPLLWKIFACWILQLLED